jgi:hypothetical protein
MRLFMIVGVAGLLGAVLPLAGCTVVADFFAPGLISSLGFDPETLSPSQGTVIVSFRNLTQSSAVFFAYKQTDASDPNTGAKTFSADVRAGQIGNEVLDCPIGLVSPGQLGAAADGGAAAGGPAAVVMTVDAQGAVTVVEVTYTGPPLLAGEAFNCGDVIEMRLQATPAGTGQGQQYVVTVRVIPGR